MAEAGNIQKLDSLCCSICLDLLKDPVTLACGHSYCTDCIRDHWDKEDLAAVYSCPQCRHTFTPRPVLGRNTILAEVVEKLKKTGPQAAHCGPAAGDVECDVCTGGKLKALKSCLVCLASYCQTHLTLHNEIHPGRNHKLVDATGLQDKICPRHDKLLEVYCRTDQECICMLCTMDKHRGHDTVSAAAEWTEKQDQIDVIQKQCRKRIQQREKEVQELRQAKDSLTSSAQAAVEHSESIFTQLMGSMERRRSEVKELIRAQEKAGVSQSEGVLERLEQEIAELRRRDAELEGLKHTQDHIHLLQRYTPLSAPPGPDTLPTVTTNPHCSFDDINSAVEGLKNKCEEFCKEDLLKIADIDVSILLPLEPTTRNEFLKYMSQLAFDPETAHMNIYLDEGGKRATERLQIFGETPRVLCRESLSGCCYWEVEWNGQGWVDIAVTHINTTGNENFRSNDQSWCLSCEPHRYVFYHNNQETAVSGDVSRTIGVYVDQSAGTLSFYRISDTTTLLHRVHTTFTQPLYAGFTFGRYCSVYINQRMNN